MHFEASNKSSEGYWSPESECSEDEILGSIPFPPVLPQSRPRSRHATRHTHTTYLPGTRGQQYHGQPTSQHRVVQSRQDSYWQDNTSAMIRSHPYRSISPPLHFRTQQPSQRAPLLEFTASRNTRLPNEPEYLPIPPYTENSAANKATRRHPQTINSFENSRYSNAIPYTEPRIVELNPSQGEDDIASRVNMSELRNHYDNATILGINNRLKNLAQKLTRSRTYLHACMDLYTWCQTDSAYCFHTEKTLIHCLKIIVRKSRRLGYNVNYGWQVLRVIHQRLAYFQPRRREIVTRMYTTMCELSNNPIDLPAPLSLEGSRQAPGTINLTIPPMMLNSNLHQRHESPPTISLNLPHVNSNPSSYVLPAVFIGDTGEMLRRIGGAVDPIDEDDTVSVKLEDFTKDEVEIIASLEQEIPSIEIKEERYEPITCAEPTKDLPILHRFPIPFIMLASRLEESRISLNFDITDIEHQSLSRKQKSPQPFEPMGVFLTFFKKDINLSWPEMKVSLNGFQIPLEAELLKDHERSYIDISNYCSKENKLQFNVNMEYRDRVQNVQVGVKINIFKPIGYLESELRNKCIKAEQGKELVQYLASKYQATTTIPSDSTSNQEDVGGQDTNEVIVSQPSIWLSLRCPISHERIRTPVKGVRCGHVACFDLHTYLHLNAMKPRWECPICDRDLPLEELRCDVMVENILAEITEPAIMGLELTPHLNYVKGRRVDGCWLEFELIS
ncbi:Zinc finger MIZ domain-containing protein 2 [Basidiobolus ranarum]|uniref:Zinc finger MIZ domain-containing protein 2 n=1 Tax=Basidiobolus ranarum TaxID=34480 RepID=A0ABR2X2W7_9FUNG